MTEQLQYTNQTSSRRVMLVMMSLSALYNYLYSMTVSTAYSMSPVLGGTLFLSGAVAIAYGHTFLGERRKRLTRRARVLGTLLLCCIALMAFLLWVFYPIVSGLDNFWKLLAITAIITIRGAITARLIVSVVRGHVPRVVFAILFILVHVIFSWLAALLFFRTIHPSTAWTLYGGYGLSALLEIYTQLRDRRSIALSAAPLLPEKQTGEFISQELRQLNAYGAYQKMHMLILIALQTTLIMVYTFIGITGGAILSCLAISVACTIIARESTDFVLQHLRRRKPAVLNLLMVGLFLWVYSLFLLNRMVSDSSSLLMSYLVLGLCSTGLTISITCLAQLERDMTAVARYQLGNEMQGYEGVRAVSTELSLLTGQLIALFLLAAMTLPDNISITDLNFTQMLADFRPLLVVPPLLITIGAFLSVLRFPMNNRHFQKLKRFLALTDEENPALKKQLDSVVVHKHKNRFGIRIIIFFLRFFMPNKVTGKQYLKDLKEGTVILVCNHGEVYGPVAATLHVPIPFRPWSISEMMDKDVIVDYLYKNTAVRQKWCPNFLKMPLTRLFAKFFLWTFKSLDAIPVYRNNPRSLIKTFRLTVDAMQAEDNLLIFPERGDAEEGERGYATQGIGELYTGFATIAQALYLKTHKCAVFIPTYASKQRHTLSFASGITYNPDAPPAVEKLRIVQTLQASIQAMAALDREAL